VHVELVYEHGPRVSIGRRFVVTAAAIAVMSVTLLLVIIELGRGNPAPRPLPTPTSLPSSISAISQLKADRELGLQAGPDPKGDDP
jgi:hypothetical protein